MKFSIRSVLLAVAVLGLVTCGLALFALARPLAAANTGRIERAQDKVEGEVRRLHVAGARPSSGSAGQGMTMHSGFVSPDETFESLALPWSDAPDALRDVLADSQHTKALASDHHETSDGILFVAIEPTGSPDRYAWAASMMPPAHTTPVLRVVGIALDVVALTLAVFAIFAVLVVRRGADALTRCLALLGRDLSTPVPRSRVAELSSVADGIADLARDLAHTQHELAERERLAVLGRVTAGVAHELRNPLAVMKLRIDLMRRNVKVPPEITPELDVVVEEVVRLDRLVNDLLTIAGRRLSEQRDLDVGRRS
jgi:signal transduction histidine kinase